MVSALIANIISGVIVVLVFSTLMFPKKIHYLTSGLMLISLGALQILNNMGYIGLDITRFPVFNYAAIFLITFAGKDLLKEGFKEKQSALKYPSMILAVVIVALTYWPSLKNAGVVSFSLTYPPIFDSILLIVSGVFLIIGVFTLLSGSE